MENTDDNDHVLRRIKDTVQTTDPHATLILYGSYARGDYQASSDIDLLILIDKKHVNREDQKRLKYPLYEIEFETGKIISPIVLSKNEWHTRHRGTPFYENVSREGQIL